MNRIAHYASTLLRSRCSWQLIILKGHDLQFGFFFFLGMNMLLLGSLMQGKQKQKLNHPRINLDQCSEFRPQNMNKKSAQKIV